MTNMQKITSTVTKRELLMQLAEECSELAKAALKLARTLPDSTNPTPIAQETAFASVLEEYADICVAYTAVRDGVLPHRWQKKDPAEAMRYKEERWAARLAERKLEKCAGSDDSALDKWEAL